MEAICGVYISVSQNLLESHMDTTLRCTLWVTAKRPFSDPEYTDKKIKAANHSNVALIT
jgi:hypothetical protein